MSYYYQYQPNEESSYYSSSNSYGSSPSSTSSSSAISSSSTAATSLYSRPSSVSPPMSKAYPFASSTGGAVAAHSSPNSPNSLLSHSSVVQQQGFTTGINKTARFEASRGFDLEDDLEFCPALLQATASSTAFGRHLGTKGGLTITNPASSVTTSTTVTSNNASTSLTTSSTGSPSRIVRIRRGIEIVDPSTGLRVASPPLTPAKLGRV